MVKHRNRLPRDFVEFQFLEGFKIHLDIAVSNWAISIWTGVELVNFCRCLPTWNYSTIQWPLCHWVGMFNKWIYGALFTSFSECYTHYCFVWNHLGIFPLDKWQLVHLTGRGTSTEYTYHFTVFLDSVYTPCGSRFPEGQFEHIPPSKYFFMMSNYASLGICLLSVWILTTFCSLW